MNQPAFDPKHKAVLDPLLLNIPGVVAGKMFGYPGYYINKRLFACVYGEGVAVKVSEERGKELLSKRHVVPFQPLGKAKMKEWIQINRTRSSDYEKDLDVFRASIDFVSKMQNVRRKKK
jgi:hypothetical protein